MHLMKPFRGLWFLDQSKDTQFVKINRSFLGYGNNVDYAAAINDCTILKMLWQFWKNTMNLEI